MNGRGNGFAENDADSGSSGYFGSIWYSDEHRHRSGTSHYKQNSPKQRNHRTGCMGFPNKSTDVDVTVQTIFDWFSESGHFCVFIQGV